MTNHGTRASARRSHAKPATGTSPAQERPRLLGMDDAIAALATTRPTFYRWLRSGAITGIKVGRQWRFQPADIDRFLAGKGPRIDLPGDIKRLIAGLEERLGTAAASIQGDPVTRAVALMVGVAHHLRASDLHLCAFVNDPGAPVCASLQLRIDGALQELATFDVRLLPLLIDQWKRLAALTDAAGLPQEGWCTARSDGVHLDIRVIVLPTTTGDSLTARFLDPHAASPNLDRYGFADRDRRVIDRSLTLPHGLIVFSGPVGSGKSTTLYAALAHQSSRHVKVMTVEESIAYHLPRVVRVQVDADRGLSYPVALRGCLRADPDIVGIGGLGDRDTMEMAVECAVTGHLVMACIHTSSAIDTLRRVLHLSDAQSMVIDELAMVTSQRLIRRLCSECAVAEAPDAASLRTCRSRARAGGMALADLGTQWKRGAGCERCRGTGVRGRIPVFEVLEVTREIRQALVRGDDDDALRAIAVAQGMTTMVADGIRKASIGETSLLELQHSLPDLLSPA